MSANWQKGVPTNFLLSSVGDSLHIDLGCGSNPRNPLKASRTVAVDLFESSPFEVEPGILEYVQSHFGAELPFGSNEASSISAFDFLEHVPRVDRRANGEFFNPFIEVMNEVHRVLLPGGVFIALTPCFPSAAAFSDPTHVNFITEETHLYFSGPNYAKTKGYGFRGEFLTVQAGWSDWRGHLWDASALHNAESEVNTTFRDRNSWFSWSFLDRFFGRTLKRNLRARLLGHSGETHFLWVLQKPRHSFEAP